MRYLIIPIIVLAALLVPNAAAQEAEIEGSLQIDEFGRVPDCEFGARVDAMFIYLSNRQDYKAYVVVYRGSRALPASQATDLFEMVESRFRSYILMNKFDPTRVDFIDGGLRDQFEFVNEIWMVPPGGAVPTPTKTVSKTPVDLSKTVLIDAGFVYVGSASVETVEPETSEMTELDAEAEVEPAETVENTEDSDESPEADEQLMEESVEETDIETDAFELRSKYWEGLLKNDPEARGVVYFYADKEAYDIPKSISLIEEMFRAAQSESGLDLKRVDIKYGGYREGTLLEFWFVPKGGDSPVPSPHPIPVPATSPENK